MVHLVAVRLLEVVYCDGTSTSNRLHHTYYFLFGDGAIVSDSLAALCALPSMPYIRSSISTCVYNFDFCRLGNTRATLSPSPLYLLRCCWIDVLERARALFSGNVQLFSLLPRGTDCTRRLCCTVVARLPSTTQGSLWKTTKLHAVSVLVPLTGRGVWVYYPPGLRQEDNKNRPCILNRPKCISHRVHAGHSLPSHKSII